MDILNKISLEIEMRGGPISQYYIEFDNLGKIISSGYKEIMY